MADVERTKKRWPGVIDAAFPDVFTSVPKCAIPPSKPGQLQEGQVKQFFEKGYVIVEDFFTSEELEPVKGAINRLVDDLAHKLYKAGKIPSLFTEYGFYQRLTKMEEEFPGSNIILHKTGKLPQAMKDILANERILNMMEQLLGSTEVLGHPVWNIRTKTPRSKAGELPWHQDNAYFSTDAYGTLVPTAWIPLLDANEENGCLQVLQGGQRTGKTAEHQCCHGGTWYVMLTNEEMQKTLGVDAEKDCVPCPVRYGGFILFNNATPHSSLANVSENIRWSMDLRWCAAGQPVGLWGLKDGVLLRSQDPNHKVSWEVFDSVDRTKAQGDYLKVEMDEFDTTVPGPWMEQWEIVHVNRHTEAYLEELQAGVASTPLIVG